VAAIILSGAANTNVSVSVLEAEEVDKMATFHVSSTELIADQVGFHIFTAE
jgi:hypothetical protein